MAEALVSLVLEQLTLILSEQTEAGLSFFLGSIDEQVQKLTSNFQAIKAVLEDAESRQVKENAVRDWLDKLKEVAYDMDDALDKWNTAIRTEITNASDHQKRRVCFSFPSCRFSPSEVFLRHDIASKIKHLNKKLDHIAKGKDMFNFSSSSTCTHEELLLERSSWTTSFTDEPAVYGRDQDKNKLINLLLKESSSSSPSRTIPVISIIGMGGIGKTTLAQLVFNDDEVSAYFDAKIWVCVSNHFDEVRIAKAVLESLKGEAPNLFELQNVLQCIREHIKGKRFLLVLDDVWSEDPRSWKQLRGSLMSGSPQSRILVTTRKENVANVMGTTNLIPLGTLSEEGSWLLFSQIAFSGRNNEEECKKLENIGRMIVHKCKGLPLAVKTLVGSLLRYKRDIKDWQIVLDSGLWELEEVERGIFPPLLLSYNDLPFILRKCFLYCAVFPKDYVIEKDKLIKLWMAQGYLKAEGREDMEQVGEKYFEDLAMRSFFQDFERSENGGSISCKMHDIVHGFAQYSAKNECLFVGDSLKESQSKFSHKKIRHLMVIRKPMPVSICKEKKLRSLFVEIDPLSGRDLSKLLEQLMCLRTLEFGEHSVQQLPREINQLTHLRYLNMSKNELIRELPEELCDLYNLQTLDISYCTNLRKLPQGIGKLINLRHLINDDTFSVSYMPRGMERLTSLRTLRKFVLSGSVNRSRASSLGCLKNLDQLQGYLFLRRLGNVNDVAEAEQAELKNMHRLTSLRLWFHKREASGGRMSADNELVLEALQPPPGLQTLHISGYEGRTLSPVWMPSLTNLMLIMFLNKIIT